MRSVSHRRDGIQEAGIVRFWVGTRHFGVSFGGPGKKTTPNAKLIGFIVAIIFMFVMIIFYGAPLP